MLIFFKSTSETQPIHTVTVVGTTVITRNGLDFLLFFSSALPSGHLAQWVPVESVVVGQRPGALRPSGGQAGQLFTGLAAHATAQLFARHAAGTAAEHAAPRARVHHRVWAQRGRRHHRRRYRRFQQARHSIG